MTNKWLKHILENLHRDAFIWAVQCCRQNDELAKDVLQTVYLKIVEKRAKFHEKSSIKTWLFRIIRNTAIDHMKLNDKYEQYEHRDEQSYDLFEEAVQGVEYQNLISQLPGRQRQILTLVFYHNMTLEQASSVMDITLGTTRTHYDRGKKNLKKFILKMRQYG